jgi:hypothetical protein
MDIQIVLIVIVSNYASLLRANDKITQWSLVSWKRTLFETSNYTITYDTQSQQNNFLS